MTTLNISLPDQMRSFIEAQVSGGLYSSASDYVRALIREDQQRQEQLRLESQLLAALESGKFEEMTPDFFERLREQARQASARSGKPT
jgi:antitoxin ParD1/3/4